MCLAAAYIGEGSEQPIMQEIARLRIDGDMIEIETLFGEGKVIQGRVAEIDFMKSRVVIEE
jgi:predicted RNA-binding protein